MIRQKIRAVSNAASGLTGISSFLHGASAHTGSITFSITNRASRLACAMAGLGSDKQDIGMPSSTVAPSYAYPRCEILNQPQIKGINS